MRSKRIKKGILSQTNKRTFFEGHNYIGNFSSFRNSYIGKGSYIGSRCHLSHVKIGRFCSIGDEVSVVCGTHPITEYISSSPVFYSRNNVMGLSYSDMNFFDEFKFVEDEYLISVGNDVWIGTGVKILQGVCIGDGAIIAAGAVVVKDVKPYTIVGGVPAKFIKQRFSDRQIKLLLNLSWWNWDDETLKDRSCLFASPEKFFCNLGEFDLDEEC